MLSELLRRYQAYNPDTGKFDSTRSLRQYARDLGISHPTLVMIYGGDRNPGVEVLRALVQLYPIVRNEIGDALAAEPEREAVAS